jgi:hypothetical protein
VPNQEESPFGTPLPQESAKLIAAFRNRGEMLFWIRLQQLSPVAEGVKLKTAARQVSVSIQAIAEMLPAAGIAMEAVNEDDRGAYHQVSF